MGDMNIPYRPVLNMVLEEYSCMSNVYVATLSPQNLHSFIPVYCILTMKEKSDHAECEPSITIVIVNTEETTSLYLMSD